MAKRRIRQTNIREYIVLFFAIVISISLIFSSYKKFDGKIKESGLSLFSLLNFSSISFKKYGEIENENRFLKELLVKLRIENIKLKEANIQNQRLKKLLEIKKENKFNYIYAEVIGYDNFNSKSYCILDKGSDNGIEKDDTVISINGLIGNVEDVSENFSRVKLISNPNMKVSLRTEINRIPCIMEAVSFKEAELLEITKTQDVSKGEKVYTSNLSTLFPQGIPVGEVVEVYDEPATFAKKVKMRYLEDLKNIESVFILKAKEVIEKDSIQ